MAERGSLDLLQIIFDSVNNSRKMIAATHLFHNYSITAGVQGLIDHPHQMIAAAHLLHNYSITAGLQGLIDCRHRCCIFTSDDRCGTSIPYLVDHCRFVGSD